MNVAVVTDSTAYLPPELAREHGIRVVPLHVFVAGHERREGIDITLADLSEALRQFRPVTTSRPAPQVFLDLYEELAAAGADAVVSLHISAEMSGTVQSAQLAAAQAPVPVHVVDSRSIGMAMGFAAVSAAQAASGGADAVAVAEVARARSAAAHVVFYVDSLEHLQRGGRIGLASALLGSALAIKPILAVLDGRIVARDRVRTTGKALARLVELSAAAADAAERAGQVVDIAVQHLDSVDRAEQLVTTLRERVPGAGEIRLGELGAVVGAHVGPGTLAITVSPRAAS
ncbi:MAG TPA: DegV family protein [Candidatus Lustribacter sp.]|nr:DegV family protein [Candidatus Lustribacter sp.]